MVSSYGGADKVPVSMEQEKGRRRKQPEKADEANTEKWEKKVQNLKGKIQAKKGFIEAGRGKDLPK